MCFLSLFCLHQESQQWLSRLIPDKQCLNDQLKQVQQNSLHSKNIFLNTALKIWLDSITLDILVQTTVHFMLEFGWNESVFQNLAFDVHQQIQPNLSILCIFSASVTQFSMPFSE